MKNNSKVFCVSAGMKMPKKLDNILTRQSLYPNYGLVSLASVLKQKGYDVEIFHGDFQSATILVKKIVKKGLLESSFPLLLSIPSSFAITWTQEFCLLIKEISPNCKIVLGGKWVICTNQQWLKEKFPKADLFVFGNAEKRIEDILYPINWAKVSYTSASNVQKPEPPLKRLTYLDFGLIHDFEKYQPSVEISRGCGYGCSFCLEKNVPFQGFQDPKIVINHLQRLHKLYGFEKITPYFQASYFHPSWEWINSFVREYLLVDLGIEWRAQTRVDGISPKKLFYLAKSGLKVLDIGLESASPTQLLAMQKTKDPGIYLKKAANILQACKESDIWAKLNILLYAGETFETINETIDWLSNNEQNFKGVSVNPLYIYRFNSTSYKYMYSLADLGAYPVDEFSLEKNGYATMHLSQEIDYLTSKDLALNITRRFMSADDYYDLKKFSYFPRKLTKQQFIFLTQHCDSEAMPFGIN